MCGQVDVLEVQHPGHQTAVGTGHKAPQLAAQAHIPHAGGGCENCDKFAVDRPLPPLEAGDLLVIHDTGAHGHSMGYNIRSAAQASTPTYSL